MGTMIGEVVEYLHEIAPPEYQESYDNAGLITGGAGQEVKGALFCLDATETVVSEAVEKNCNLVIAHHPILFRPIDELTGADYVQRTLIQAIKNDIAILAVHTNLDNVLEQGVNQKIAERLDMEHTEILSPSEEITTADKKVGSGLIGRLPDPRDEMEFLHFVKKRMKTDCVKYTPLLDQNIECVALCGGAGGFLLEEAIDRKADIFITSDIKYHEFFDADGQIVLADIGHYESEQFTIDLLFDVVSEKFNTFALHKTSVRTNPVKYLT